MRVSGSPCRPVPPPRTRTAGALTDEDADALNVCVSSSRQVEKSLQRIQSGQSNPMYTSQQSVENKVCLSPPRHTVPLSPSDAPPPRTNVLLPLKVGGVPGWQALLSAVGFRLDFSAGGAGPPAAVFFPTSDPGDRLQQCSTTLQALLGKTPPSTTTPLLSAIACTCRET